MKQILLYILLFVAVIGLIFGIFYLIITLKTPTEGLVIEDILGDVMDQEIEEKKLDYRFEGNGENGEEVELIEYEGEEFSLEYPSNFNLEQVEITTEADETIKDTAEEVQLGTTDFYRVEGEETVSYYTFENGSGLGFTVSYDLEELLKEILETINFENL